MTLDSDIPFMEQALELANLAQANNEVPIGAIVVCDGKVIGKGANQRETSNCALDHAEMIAITQACKTLGSWRLVKCTLYATLEPCIMCAGALWQARIERVVYGASDPKGGALGSLYTINEDTRLNHRFEVNRGVLAQASTQMLRNFFHKRRTT